MKRFQYKFVESIGRVPIRALNEYGAEGWEVVAFDYGGVILKREVVEEVPEIEKTDGIRGVKMYTHLRRQHRHEVLSDVDLFEFHNRLYPDCDWSV